MGGIAYLRELLDVHPEDVGTTDTADYVLGSAGALHELWAARCVIDLAEEMTRLAAELIETALKSNPHTREMKGVTEFLQSQLDGMSTTLASLRPGFGA